jgi:hypothetical protein
VEDDDEAVDVVEAVVQRRRCDSEDIRFALVNDNAVLFNVLLDRLEKARVQEDTELGAALCRVRGCDDGVGGLGIMGVVQQSCFQVGGQAYTALAQRIHGGESEDVQAGHDGSHIQRAGIAELEAAGACDGDEFVLHAEAAALVASPPAAQTRSVGYLRFVFGRRYRLDLAVLLMHEQSSDNAGTAIHVLVVAPGGKVDVPVVQLQGHVTNGVCEIPSNYDTERVAVAGNELNVEKLARVELDAWKQDESCCGSMAGDDGENVFVGEVGRGGRRWIDSNERRRVETVVGYL